jgi:Flp pilus assembly protein protease CpaA
LIKIAYFDWKTRKIQNHLVGSLMVLSLGMIWIMPEISFLQRISGFFSVSILLLLMAGIVPGSIGGGDIKLMAAGGFLLGISHIWTAFMIGILSAGGYVIFLLMRGSVDKKTEIALGPFLCAGISYMLLT